MTAAYGDVPLLDPDTGRFPDDFAPPSVAAAVTDAQTARQGAEDAFADAVELVGDVTAWDARVAAAEAAAQSVADTLTTTDAGVAGFVADTTSETSAALDAAPTSIRARAGYGTASGPATKTGCLTIIDDDGAAAVMTRLAPILAARGVPGACAIITGGVGQTGYMGWADVEALIAAGWEMLGHGDTYVSNLTELTTPQLAADFTKCRADLRAHGAQPVGFVYPQGVSNAAIRAEMREHFAFAFAGSGINPAPLRTDQIQRIAFGSWTGSNPTISGNAEKSTLAYYQACVDYAVANKSWLVLMTHVAQQDAAADTMLGTLLDYAVAQSMPVVTPTEGYRIHGNRVWAGDSLGDWVAVSDSGVYGSKMHPSWWDPVNSVPATTTPAAYRQGVTTMMATASWAIAQELPGAGGSRAGTVVTFVARSAIDQWQWIRQDFRCMDGRIFIRAATSETTWGAWDALVRTSVAPYRLAATNAYAASVAPSGYPDNAVTVAANNTAGGAGFPNNAAGLTTTYRVAGTGWDRQEWRPYNNHGLWSRYSIAGDTWSEWVKLSVG